MADGTLRITLDIEPRHSKNAFNLFGAPGTPCALAALHCRSAAEQQEQPKTAGETPKGGALAKLAGLWCEDDDFCDWLATYRGGEWNKAEREVEFCNASEIAAQTIRDLCEIESRAQLDHDAVAAERFQGLIRGPYMKHQLVRGVTT